MMWTIVKWCIIIAWRFFSGAHMDGSTYNDATWWQDASSRYRVRRQAYTWWRRKARMKRASWRNCIFWPVTLIILGFVWSSSSMAIILLALSPFLAFVAFRRGRLALFKPVTQTLSDGIVIQHWYLKSRPKRILQRLHLMKRSGRKMPGLARREELVPAFRVKEIPSELRGAVVRELAEELEGQPPIEMKLLMSPGENL